MADQQFDVFLCHNSEDKPAVIKIAQQLQHNNLKPWLDVWELQPGRNWQYALEQQIENIGAAAVFVGQQGLGPWQEEEIYALLQVFVGRRCPVIPVLLPGAPQQPRLPIFLRSKHWVDFRLPEPEPMAQLIWGITGQKAGEMTTPDVQSMTGKQNCCDDLRALLEAGNWEEADAETARIMIHFSGDESTTQFVDENIDRFPCGILLEIDALWARYSQNKFGFKSQSRVWNRSKRRFEVFADRVGWRINDTWLKDSDLTYNLDAPVGHLPSLNWVHIQGWAVGNESCGHNIYQLIDRFSSCLKLKSRGKFHVSPVKSHSKPKGFHSL